MSAFRTGAVLLAISLMCLVATICVVAILTDEGSSSLGKYEVGKYEVTYYAGYLALGKVEVRQFVGEGRVGHLVKIETADGCTLIGAAEDGQYNMVAVYFPNYTRSIWRKSGSKMIFDKNCDASDREYNRGHMPRSHRFLDPEIVRGVMASAAKDVANETHKVVHPVVRRRSPDHDFYEMTPFQ